MKRRRLVLAWQQSMTLVGDESVPCEEKIAPKIASSVLNCIKKLISGINIRFNNNIRQREAAWDTRRKKQRQNCSYGHIEVCFALVLKQFNKWFKIFCWCFYPWTEHWFHKTDIEIVRLHYFKSAQLCYLKINQTPRVFIKTKQKIKQRIESECIIHNGVELTRWAWQRRSSLSPPSASLPIRDVLFFFQR